jgi:uncharacterized protein DUF3761
VQCKGGTTSKDGRGACSHHGGIAAMAPADDARDGTPAVIEQETQAPQPQTTPRGRTPATADSSACRQPAARCKDGSLFYSQHRSGTCSRHGGRRGSSSRAKWIPSSVQVGSRVRSAFILAGTCFLPVIQGTTHSASRPHAHRPRRAADTFRNPSPARCSPSEYVTNTRRNALPEMTGRTYLEFMAVFHRLVFELAGTCDRKAVVALLERASGVRASEIELDFSAVRDIAVPALRLLAASIRRYHSGRKISVRGLAARDAAALIRYGVAASVVVSVRPGPLPTLPSDPV